MNITAAGVGQFALNIAAAGGEMSSGRAITFEYIAAAAGGETLQLGRLF